MQKRSEALILGVLLAVTGLAYLLHWYFTVDDAAISFSYARNFAHGYGLGALYPGAPRVEGYSNFLWVVLLAAGTKVGLDTLLASKILGLLFSLGVIALLYLLLRRFVHNCWLLLGLVLLPLSLTFTFWSVSGLENSLYAFLILLSVYFLLREDELPAKIPLGSALSLVLVGMTRPEGLVYALAGFGYKTLQLVIRWRHTEDRRLLAKNLLSWLAMFLLGYGLFKVWHFAYFAAWWPNPIYAKAGWYKTDLNKIWFEPGGWTYLRGYFRSFAAVGLIPALIFGGLVSLKGPQRVFSLFALASLVLPLYTFDWMVNYRFIYPFLPFEAALLVLAADQLWSWIFAVESASPSTEGNEILSGRAHPLWLRVGSVILAIWFGFGVARFAWANLRLTQRQLACGYAPMAETACLSGKMYWSIGEVDQKYSALQKYAAQIGLSDPLYMIPDIGATSYLQNKRILDLAGLADYQIARIRDGSLLKQYIFQEQRPDFVMTYGIWTRRTDLTNFNAFQESYLPIEQGTDSTGLMHGIFVRKDLLLSPALSPLDSYLCELAPGLFLVSASTSIDTFWLASQPQPQDWNIKITLRELDDTLIHEQIEPLGYGWYPTSQWQPDELFRQSIRLPEDLPAGDYHISLQIVGNSGVSPDEDKHRRCDIPVSTHDKDADQDLGAGQLQNLLNTAQAAWDADDLDGLFSSLKAKNFEIGRDRQEWHVFGRELRRAASDAAKQKNWQRAYQLYWAAALANPDDAWAQHGLELARQKTFQPTN